MIRTTTRVARLAMTALVPLVLAACGGGGGSNQSTDSAALDAASTADSDTSRMKILSAASKADASANVLIVRAHGALAGEVGPMLRVLVNGVVIDTIEVRATVPTDYRFTVPALREGAKVDVVYLNDALVGGVDRNLFISQITAGSTYVLPTSPGVTVDWGTGAAAFDGQNVVPGQGPLWSNGALRATWPAPNMPDRLTVRASGKMASGGGPNMDVVVNGIVVGSTEVRSSVPTDYTFAVPALKPGNRVDLAVTNVGTINGEARELNVAYMMSGTTVLLPTSPNASFDQGSGSAAFDGINVTPGQATLATNGALRGKWPAVNMTETLTVRASGTPAGGEAPVMQVLVDGVLLGSRPVGSATASDFTFSTLPMKAGNAVQVVFTNPGSVGNQTRGLAVAYAISGRTYLLATKGSLEAAWPEPNLLDTLTVRARGSVAGEQGPIMQVLVDGVMIGRTEVRASEFTDYGFPAPAMQSGRKVDVVYTNDALVNGVDRNLFIAYLISGNTFLLPDAAGTIYDRGTGNAAFDGQDAFAGHGNLYWSGALRMIWPAPNITDTLTVRAQGTVAGRSGPVMQVWVDGVAVSSVEVRSPTAADYRMPVPPLRVGSRIDIAYVNAGVVDGVERNLTVLYAIAGNTFVQPASPAVRYDVGIGDAAFDGQDVLPGRSAMGLNGALRFTWPTANFTDTITVRASANLAQNIGAMMQLRVDGVIVGTQEVRSTSPANYVFLTPRVQAGSRIDVVFTNDLKTAGGEDRNLFVQYVKLPGMTLVPTANGVVLDTGSGESAVDGIGTVAGSSTLSGNGALRWVVPAPSPASSNRAAQYAAARLLMQGGFGGRLPEIERVTAMGRSAWIDEQLARPASPDFVNAVQSRYDMGDAYRPFGAMYTPAWVAQRFWQAAATAPDALRKRMMFALHQILMVSQAESNLFGQARAYAAYLDILNANAFGNFRALLEEVALSPAMGIYLSHMRNRPEDLVAGRMPDENFAREIMQLFTIGLHELNIDGTLRLDGQGNPIETYTNDDVMAMAKVFTGYGWAFPVSQLTETRLRWSSPDLSAAGDSRIDLLRMKAYPGMHSMSEKRLFKGKGNALVIPAGTPAADSLRLALDTLFNHPNVGPFISRQLIQRLVTSDPSPAYVARVASMFNNNGRGVRGDLGAVLRAILMDSEAVSPPASAIGKLREPVLRIANWMRAFDARSATGEWLMVSGQDSLGQKALYAPSVFGYFRPGYVPPNTRFAVTGTTVPEMQSVNEATTAQWVNTAMGMASDGIGWTGTVNDVAGNLQPLAAMATQGDIDGLIEHLNLLLYAGRMSANLKHDLLEAIVSVNGNTPESQINRARVALFIALASSEYMVQP